MIKISIAENLSTVREEIEKALARSGRSGEHVELIAVTKTVGIDGIILAKDAGATSIGENRVQELEAKYEELNEGIDYHMIGHLQSNKAKDVIGKVKLVHSLDRMSLAKQLNRRAKRENLVQDVLVQVNIAEEETKHGLKIEEVIPFIESVLSMENIRIRGLMTMAPHVEDEREIREVFRSLYKLQEDIKAKNYSELSMDYLSMGMTNDYTIAIEEGSNMVRVGRAIFGERNY